MSLGISDYVRMRGGEVFFGRLVELHRACLSRCESGARDFRALCGYSGSLSNAVGDSAYDALVSRVMSSLEFSDGHRKWLTEHVLNGDCDLPLVIHALDGDDATFSLLSSSKRRRSRRRGFFLLCVCLLLFRPVLKFRGDGAGCGDVTHAGLLRSVYDWHDRDSVEYARLLHGALLHVGLCF